MKIRTGFVANSSSSSFMISLPKNERKLKLEIEIDLNESFIVEKTIKTKSEIEEHCEEYEFDDNTMSEMIKHLNSNRNIFVFNVSNEDDEISNLLYNCHEDKVKFRKLVENNGAIKIKQNFK